MAPPRQLVKKADATAMQKVGARYGNAVAELEAAQGALDKTVRRMSETGYNVSACARALGVTRNTVYRSLERSG